MVPRITSIGLVSPTSATEINTNNDKNGAKNSRTVKKSPVAPVRLEDIWKGKVIDKGWSVEACIRFQHYWASSTLNTYNSVLTAFKGFCVDNQMSFPPAEMQSQSCITNFLCNIANSSDRPRSSLNNATAAINCFYEAINETGKNPLQDTDVRKLVGALVKTGTVIPRKKTPVMSIEPFKCLFLQWPKNEQLTVKQLRLKTLTLLALVMMLRPSDPAPRGQTYNQGNKSMEKMVLSTDQIEFNDDGSATINLFGIKNDTRREGFEVHIDPTEECKLNPVLALKNYIDRTRTIRPVNNHAVFLTLIRPYRAIDSSTVSKILQEAIALAGLDTSVYSAKCFRPTGATVSIEQQCNPDVVRQVGRWKNREVFEEHYVHSKAQKGITNKILNI